MNIAKNIHALVCCAVLVAMTPAQAGIINGSFESGLLGWNSLGGTGTVGDVGRYNPTDGASQGAVQTSIGPFNVSDDLIAVTLGLPNPTGLTNFFEMRRIQYGPPPDLECGDRDNCFTFRSSAVWQTFEAKAGKTIVFDFNFLTREGGRADSAFVIMSTENTDTGILLADSLSLAVLGDPVDGYTPSGTASTLAILRDDTTGHLFGLYPEPDIGDTGYLQYSLIVPETGLVTLAFAVLDASDGEDTSALLIDNVQLVPEPTTLLLLGLGLAGLGFARKRLH